MAILRSLLRPTLLWPLLLLSLVLLYVLGLGGPYAPTNGDEMVYIHIARVTSESGHWLPLQSELAGMRNTKPPLLIWQAIIASGWGAHWNLLALRLPSLAYSFATAALLAFFTWRLSGKRSTAWLAAALYLLFFSTFRYGRVYLTSAPETFWLALPMWWLLWLRLRKAVPPRSLASRSSLPPEGANPAWGGPAPGSLPPRSLASRSSLPPEGANPAWGGPAPGSVATPVRIGWLAYSLFGLAMGLGTAYKSFALLAPASAALWCALLWGEPRLNWQTLARATAGVSWSALLGLGIFSLWFVLDPDPGAVWQEFVLGENAGKLSNTMGYWQNAWNGPYPMWTQLLAYPVNAGLLALTGLGFCVLVIRRGLRPSTWLQLNPAQRVLVAWLLVWLIVFTLPSQRSERYVIPAMPALAIAMALLWQRIGRIWSLASLLLMAPALVLLARIAWVIGAMDVGSPLLAGLTLLVAGLGLLTVFLGLFNAGWTRNASLLVCATVYASFGLMVAPLSHPESDYAPAIQAHIQGRRVAVPNGFTGQFEHYRFVLPGAQIHPYDAEGRNTGELYPEMAPTERLQRLLREFDAVVWLQEDTNQEEPSCLPGCKLLAQRWHVKSRHKTGDITLDNLWYPQEWLFSREWLLEKPAP